MEPLSVEVGRYSNIVLGDVTIALTERKPFDVLAEGPNSENGVSDGIRTRDPRDHNPMLYPTELRSPPGLRPLRVAAGVAL